MHLILEDIELNQARANEGSTFNVYLKYKSAPNPIYIAVENNGTQRFTYELSGNHKIIAKNFRKVILKYRLGKFTDEDKVTLGDIFMYAKFNLLVDHNLD
jgi:hypothetical protein